MDDYSAVIASHIPGNIPEHFHDWDEFVKGTAKQRFPEYTCACGAHSYVMGKPGDIGRPWQDSWPTT